MQPAHHQICACWAPTVRCAVQQHGDWTTHVGFTEEYKMLNEPYMASVGAGRLHQLTAHQHQKHKLTLKDCSQHKPSTECWTAGICKWCWSLAELLLVTCKKSSMCRVVIQARCVRHDQTNVYDSKQQTMQFSFHNWCDTQATPGYLSAHQALGSSGPAAARCRATQLSAPLGSCQSLVLSA